LAASTVCSRWLVLKYESNLLTKLIDIYVACVSSAHNVCPKGYWVAIVSTIAETSANHHLELQPGLDRLGKIEEQFMVCSTFAFSYCSPQANHA
jgi:RAB protein geranylgeranyltransferase component A